MDKKSIRKEFEMSSMLKPYVDWNDRVEESAHKDLIHGKKLKGFAKAFGIGAADGAIVGLIASGIIAFTAGLASIIIGHKK